MPVDQTHVLPPGIACKVGGIVVSKDSAESQAAQFSVVRRQVDQVLDWEFASPAPALIWLRQGFRRLRLDLDGKIERADCLVGPVMIFVPASVTLKGAFDVEGDASFTAVMFTPSSTLAEAPEMASIDPMVSFRHRELERSLADISREVARPDNLFDMLAEGWTMQALAHLSRRRGTSSIEQPRSFGGLSRTNRSRVEDHIRAHLSETITLTDLARLTGLTTRHLSRAFRASFSETPMQYVVALRMDQAARMLTGTRAPITQVALDCGFSHPQHFSSSFNKMIGCSPSEFRRRSG